MADAANIIFEDRFTVDTVDKDGQRFDRVSRITATSHHHRLALTLDIASELYPLRSGEAFTLAIAKSLTPDEDAGGGRDGIDGDAGVADDAPRRVRREAWRSGDEGLAADYEYVMYGKIYKFDDSATGENQTTAYFSFGGLLMALRGSYRHLANVVVGENVYLLVRK